MQTNDHLIKYKHNKDFFSFGISSTKGDFSDWTVIAMFYAAVHIVEAVRQYNNNENSTDHNDRDRYLRDNYYEFGRDALRDYSRLKSLAHKARYSTIDLSSDEVLEAQNEFFDFEGIMLKYCPT